MRSTFAKSFVEMVMARFLLSSLTLSFYVLFCFLMEGRSMVMLRTTAHVETVLRSTGVHQ